MQGTKPNFLMASRFQRPNRGRDALGPGDDAGTGRHPPREPPRASPFEGGVLSVQDPAWDLWRPGPGRQPGGRGADMQGTKPNFLMASRFQRPNRGRDALGPGDDAGTGRHPPREPPRASPFEGGVLSVQDPAWDLWRPGPSRQPGGRGADMQGTKPNFLMASRFQRPNRGRDALGPGDDAGTGRHPPREPPRASPFEGGVLSVQDPAWDLWRPGPRASRPRTARSAVPLRDASPAGKRLFPARPRLGPGDDAKSGRPPRWEAPCASRFHGGGPSP